MSMLVLGFSALALGTAIGIFSLAPWRSKQIRPAGRSLWALPSSFLWDLVLHLELASKLLTRGKKQ